jgi:hypothetical protein
MQKIAEGHYVSEAVSSGLVTILKISLPSFLYCVALDSWNKDFVVVCIIT